MYIFLYQEPNSDKKYFVIAADEDKAVEKLRYMKINPNSVKYINCCFFDTEDGLFLSIDGDEIKVD